MVAVIVTEAAEVAPLVLICPNVTLVSIIRSASTVTLAVATFGIPADQLATFDQRLSPPALLKLDTATSSTESFPVSLITAWLPDIVIWASWADVIPLASVPKETSLSAAPVITTFPVPQSDDELSANAADVTSVASAKFNVPEPIVIVPMADWFLLIVSVGLKFPIAMFPLSVLAPFTVILAPSFVTFNEPADLRNVPSSATFEMIVTWLFVDAAPPAVVRVPAYDDPS